MAKKYDIRLVWKYINGIEIDNVEDLENDYRFMMEVIRISNDKKIYRLCNEEVKSNYEFVKFMIETFKSDIKFINSIAKEYLDKVEDDDFTFKELNFIMCDILQNSSEKSEYIEYFTTRAIICSSNRLIIDAILSGKSHYRDKYGLGFVFVLCTDIGESKIMTRYIATEFLDEIFYKNNMSLEDLVHKQISSSKKLKEIGIKKFIISYVERFDSSLASFLHTNIDLIKNIEKRIIIILNNWDNYVSRTTRRKDCIFFQEVCDLIEQYNPDFTYSEICYYIDKKLNLPVKLSVCEEEECVELINVRNLCLNDYKCFKAIINLAREIYLSPVISWETKQVDDYETSVSHNKGKARIIKFIPKKNNNDE